MSESTAPGWTELVNKMQAEHATALAEAEARGRRQGLEEAAEHFDEVVARARLKTEAAWTDTEAGEYIRAGNAARGAAIAIRGLLATTPAETQKPETGESRCECGLTLEQCAEVPGRHCEAGRSALAALGNSHERS